MILLKPSFEFQPFDGRGIYEKIEEAGRTCYKSEDKRTVGSAAAFIKRIIKLGHESVLEHEKLTCRVVCDRGVSHEIVRHRIASYSQESTRYCDYAGGHVAFIIPPWIDLLPGEYVFPALGKFESSATARWFYAMLESEAHYENLRKAGWIPQQARSVLPNSLKTEIVMTMNIREWRHFLRLRTSAAAHPQMREIAIPMLDDVLMKLPDLFMDIEAA